MDENRRPNRKELDVFSEASNYAIVRMEGRNYPGCVIQGDSLSILVRGSKALLNLIRQTANQEAIELAEELHDALDGRLVHYERVLAAHGIDLPYRPIPRDESGA